MKIIVAVDRNWAIGCDNRLLRSIPEDMQYFKRITTGHVVVMGRRTFESLPFQRPLKDRINLVLTRDTSFCKDGISVCNRMEEVLKEAASYPDKEVYIIGGETVYREFLPYCEVCLVTKMEASYRADRHFENLDQHPDWVLIMQEHHRCEDGLRYSFCEYQNRQKKHMG